MPPTPTSTSTGITYTDDLSRIDWNALKETLSADDFDNGRTAQQLKRSFENSAACCFAIEDGRVIGKVRALSDGVCNAYVVDVWTLSSHRRRGIATEMMKRLLEGFHGQHVYLFTDDSQPFYERLGFKSQGTGLGLVVGQWLSAPGEA